LFKIGAGLVPVNSLERIVMQITVDAKRLGEFPASWRLSL